MLEALISYHEKQLENAETVIAADAILFSREMRSAAGIAAALHRAFLTELKQAQAELAGDFPLWMHLKRGTVYGEVGEVMIQTESMVIDEDVLRLYRDVKTGKWFARSHDEFLDGRFLPVVEGEANEERPVHFGDPPGIDVVLVTGEDDDRNWRFTPQEWDDLIQRSGAFEIKSENSSDEDMWGRWRVDFITEHNGKRRLQIRRV